MKRVKVAEVAVVVAMGSTWTGAVGGMQIGARQEQVGQVFSRQVFVVQVGAGLMGFGGVSTGVPLVDVTPLVLPGAELRVGWMSIGAVGVANMAPAGSNLI